MRTENAITELQNELETVHYSYVTIYAQTGGYYQGTLIDKDGVNQTESPISAFKYLLEINKGKEVRVKLYDRLPVTVSA